MGECFYCASRTCKCDELYYHIFDGENEMTEKEKEWFEFYMDIANKYASKSKDPRLKVGAIIIPEDFSKILAVGYNGWEKGGQNVPDSLEPGGSGTVHGEINCLLKFSDYNYDNCYMFCTHSCCKVCARAIVNFGKISCFVYEEEYRDTSGLDILRDRGIKVIKYTGE
jgi:dCMP deaminase